METNWMESIYAYKLIFQSIPFKKKNIQIFVEPKTSKDQELILRFQCGKRGIISDVLKGDDFKTEV